MPSPIITGNIVSIHKLMEGTVSRWMDAPPVGRREKQAFAQLQAAELLISSACINLDRFQVQRGDNTEKLRGERLTNILYEIGY